jgi:hypothetical protein
MPGSRTISIALSYAAREFKANRRVYTDFCPGNIAICPANEGLSTQASGNAEFMLMSIELSLLAQVLDSDLGAEQLDLRMQIFGQDPLIYQLGLTLKQELEAGGADSQLYAESMGMALAAHPVRRYATRSTLLKAYTGGLPGYKLQTVIAYIHAHLDQPLSLALILHQFGVYIIVFRTPEVPLVISQLGHKYNRHLVVQALSYHSGGELYVAVDQQVLDLSDRNFKLALLRCFHQKPPLLFLDRRPLLYQIKRRHPFSPNSFC